MTIITRKTSSKSISKMLQNIKPMKKGINMKKFAGKLTWKGDALAVQQRLRDDR